MDGLIGFAVLATSDDLAAIATRTPDRARLVGPTWQRYPTVGKLANALSTSKYAPASIEAYKMCVADIGQ